MGAQFLSYLYLFHEEVTCFVKVYTQEATNYFEILLLNKRITNS